MADKLDGAAIVANSLPATAIVAGSITTTQLAPSVANVVTVGSNPKIASLDYPGDDTAANTGGGQTVVINGSGFKSNVSVYINGNAVPSVTYTNANSISITTPALAAATYPLYVINTDDGGTAILIPGIQYSGTPSWVTTSPLSEQQALSSWSISLSATSDSSVTYSLQAGSSLPTGISLAANGLISGTMSSPPESDTTYNFTVVATDAEFQDASKAFSVSVTVIVDTQFQYTTLLLQADGTNNGNNHAFLDSSNNNFTITRNGNVTQGSFTPFSPTGWSYYFSSSAVTLGTTLFNGLNSSASFTMEAWVYPLSYNSPSQAWYSASIFSKGQVYLNFGLNGSGQVHLYHYDGSARTNNSNVAAPLNQWTHIAAVVTGGTITFYVNGIASGTATWYGHIGDNQIARLGSTQDSNASGSSDWLGYISNARFSTGPIYTAAFTPANSPLSVSANTRFLTGQSNRFVDSNTTPTTLTVAAGTPSVQTFSPFPTTTAYSPATHGGAAFFDGSGDYLTVANNPAFAFGTGEFTIEGWVYILAGGDKGIFQQGTSHFPTSTSNSLALGLVNSGSVWQIYAKNTNTNSTATYTLNTWTHFALVRSGTTTTLYINGASAITLTSDTTNYTGEYFGLGAIYGTSTTAINAYITNVRVVKGTAVYTSGFTPPTSPPSNIANTSLLCNFTNAQIYDADASIVLETVGDAKVNTAIKKFGAGSIALDGTGDLLFAKNNTNFDFGTGDFTVEFWINASASGTYNQVVGTQNSNADNGAWRVGNRFNSANALYFARGNGSSFDEFTASINVNDGNWHHVAVARASGLVRIFVDGVFANSSTISGTCTSGNDLRIGFNPRDSSYVTGYIDDLRITKGLARYRYNFTPPTRAFPTKGGLQTLTADEYFDYTTLLLPGNGTNNQNNHTFLDSSNNNFTITRNGNATQGTFSPFSQTGWSNYFDGTGDYLTLSSNAAFSFGTGDFTIEAWVYVNTATTYAVIIGGPSGGTTWYLEYSSTRGFYLYDGGTALNGNASVITSQWVHLAVSRSGTSLKMFVNGLNTATYTNSQSVPQIAPAIGAYNDGTYLFNGYISNLRLVKGTAIYTSNFTPSTTPLTAVTNTVLLTCSSNRFRDESTNNFAITRAGDTSVQAFSPFAPTASYAAANVGGSGYFDGSGDYLSLADNAAFDLGLSSSPFTIEFFFYPTTSSTDYQMLFSRGGGFAGWNSTNGWQIAFFLYNNFLYFQYWNGSNVITINPSLTSAQISNQWNHIVASYDGTNISLYCNGARLTTTTATFVKPSGSTITHIGKSVVSAETYYPTGYITNYRIVKGTAVYNPTSSSLTVPTSPPSNIANTSLLLNFTNAGITDATAKNVLETVGDAKISTVQSKFGGSSMVFDGNGDVLIGPASNYTNYINGTADWTYEFWVYYNALPTGGTYGASIYAQDDGAGVVSPFNIVQQGNTWKLWASTNGSAWNIFDNATLATTSLATSTWYHIAFVRYGTLRMFVNGIQVAHNTDIGAATSIHTNTSRKLWLFGTWQNNPSNAGGINGYIDDVRLTKGIARYTQNFALPTTAFLTK